MDLFEEVLKEHSKRQTLKLVNYIGDDPQRFKEAMNLFLSSNYRVAQRASWIISDCTRKHPKLIKPYLEKMIKNLDRNDIHDAVKRNTVRILQFIEIPEKLMGSVAHKCFDYFADKDCPIAVKVFSMTVLANICKKEPDLKKELKLMIEEQYVYSTAAFKSRAKKVLKEFEKN